jgi:hypothetical protein
MPPVYSEPGFLPKNTKDCKEKFGHINPSVVFDRKTKNCRPALRNVKGAKAILPNSPSNSDFLESTAAEQEFYVNELNKDSNNAAKLRDSVKSYIIYDASKKMWRIKKHAILSNDKIISLLRKAYAKIHAVKSPRSSPTVHASDFSDFSNDPDVNTKLFNYLKWIQSNSDTKAKWDALNCKKISP